ncbi:MAG: LLM class F420-dependent oxidoreductase [Ilumatobacteraceae bacterium]|nr:LLM class F420-dependent oxidoreductase [Ilumatobacteraceae bacterium]
MNRLVQMGLQIPVFSYDGIAPEKLFEAVAAQAVAAEKAGFDSVWVMDHFFQLPGLGKPSQEMFECYAILCALAARTSTVRLGAMVGGVTYRNPAVLVKSVTALDVISGGRAIWGIGAGWFELEHNSFGIEFGTFTERFEKLEEALQIAKMMFVQDRTTFEGKWFNIDQAYNSPKPIQAGGPPIMIGGSGQKKTLRMVAQYADACNVFGEAQQVRHLMNVLNDHCDRLGRNPDDICRTRLGTIAIGRTREEAEAMALSSRGVKKLSDLPEADAARVRSMMIIGNTDDVRGQVQELLDSGLDGVVFNMPFTHDPAVVALAGEALGPILKR